MPSYSVSPAKVFHALPKLLCANYHPQMMSQMYLMEIAVMNAAFKSVLGVIAAAALCFAPFCFAQAKQAKDESFKQIELTDAHVKGYIAASKELAKLAARTQKAAKGKKAKGSGDKPNPKLTAQVEAIAKKHGFASSEELDAVMANVSYMLRGFNSKGKFTEPSEALKAELKEIKAEKGIKAKEKAKMIEEIEDLLKGTPALEFKSNIAVVQKHLKELDAAAE